MIICPGESLPAPYLPPLGFWSYMMRGRSSCGLLKLSLQTSFASDGSFAPRMVSSEVLTDKSSAWCRPEADLEGDLLTYLSISWLPETSSDVEVYLLHRTDPCDTALRVNNRPELRFAYGLQVGKMLS